jgi:hypothetical protein
MLEAYADLITSLRTAAEYANNFTLFDDINAPVINQTNVDENLIKPVLFANGDRDACLESLRQQGDLLLAERLLRLTNQEARTDDTPQIDFLLGGTGE